MARARIEEVDYYELVRQVRRARDAKCIIERSEREKWQAYLKEADVRESSLLAFSKVKFAAGEGRLIAIVGASPWTGCYAFSVEDEVALKFIPG